MGLRTARRRNGKLEERSGEERVGIACMRADLCG